MVVDGYRQHLLRALAHNVIIEYAIDLFRIGSLVSSESSVSATSSRIMSLHNSTHSSQINTEGLRSAS